LEPDLVYTSVGKWIAGAFCMFAVANTTTFSLESGFFIGNLRVCKDQK
jgi:hypothetical protein